MQMRYSVSGLALLLSGVMAVSALAAQDVAIDRTSPTPGLGQVQRSVAREGAPNVLVWMMDDVGFGQLGAFGGLIETPNIDRVAAQGLRYTNYHTTPICSASRAAFLTGRNSHAVHIGGHSAMAVNFPGHDALTPRNAGTIAENLRQQGYRTYQIGKWDHLPPGDASTAGPFDYWPSGQGFDRAYSFLSYDADNFRPLMWDGHTPVHLPETPNYHLTTDMADRAIDWIGSRHATPQAPPFFMYWATGVAHSPHHAPQRWLDHYRGRFDDGWDAMSQNVLERQKALGIVDDDVALPPSPDGMRPWREIPADEQRLLARQMEAFAAALSHADEEFGRVLDELERRDELANTMIVILADNGASAEGALEGTFNEFYMANGRFATAAENARFYEGWGGPTSYPLYAMGWASAGNTPFRYYKQTAYEGGVRVPLIVSWPEGIRSRGEVRDQFMHVVDVLPTVLDVAQVSPAPVVNGAAQAAIDGVSMTATFERAEQPSPRKVQYFEMYGNRAIWADGWKAIMPHRLETWNFRAHRPITEQGWQLFRLSEDVNERHDLAEQHPEKLAELLALFDREAEANNVFPLITTDDAQRMMRERGESQLRERQGLFVYHGPVERLPETLAPPIHTHSFTMNQELDAAEGSSGSLFALGGHFGGLGLYLQDGRLVAAFRSPDGSLSQVASSTAVRGPINVGMRFTRLGAEEAEVTLLVDGREVGVGKVTGLLPVYTVSANETFDIGGDSGTTVLPGAAHVSPGTIGRTEFHIVLL